MPKLCEACENSWGDWLTCPCRIPTDAAVVLREDFKPDVDAARETVKRTRELLAQRKEDENRLQNLEDVAKAALDFSEYVGTQYETKEWLRRHLVLRKALAKIGLHVLDKLLDYDK